MKLPEFNLPDYDLPSDSAMEGIMGELETMLENLPETQQRLMALTGQAWSSDGLVKAEVGPRGQLIDVQFDPRVFRRPDTQALRASVMEAVNAAIDQVNQQSQEIVFGQIPPEVAELRAQFQPDSADPTSQMLRTDAEIMAERRRRDA